MKKIYALKYSTNKDLLTDNIVKDIKDNPIGVGTAIDDFINNDYDIVFNKTVALTSKNNKIYLYLLSGNVESLYLTFDKDNLKLTEIGEHEFKDKDFLDQCMIEVYYVIYFVYKLRQIENTKKVKSIRGKSNKKLKLKGSNIQIYKYDKTDDIRYIIDNEGNSVSFLVNDYKKATFTVPSKLYPMPNNNEIKTFTKDNTYDLENDDISRALSSETFVSGYCYSNADTIISKIKEANLDYKLDFYSGWLYQLGNMTHHAWVVVNDKHILDVAFFREDDVYDEHIKGAKEGKAIKINRELVANKVVELIKSDEPFKEKYSYGKILNNCLYIGVKTNSIQARQSFNSLLEKNPNHPNYKNLNPDRSNKTLELIYNKL